MSPKLIGWSLLLLAAGLNGAGSLLLKQSRLKAPDAQFVNLILSPWFLAGLGCYGVNVILFTKALERLAVSVAYPVLAGGSFVLISLIAAWLFHERLSPLQWVGATLVLAGILLLTLHDAPAQAS